MGRDTDDIGVLILIFYLAMAKAIPTTCAHISTEGLKGYNSNVIFFIVQGE